MKELSKKTVARLKMKAKTMMDEKHPEKLTHKTWDELKQEGSNHYKSGKTEPIDLYRDAKPHTSLSAFAVKALTDNIKYAYRMLTTKGVNESDCLKMRHYTELLMAESMDEK